MAKNLISTCSCALRDFLRSKVGSRTSSLVYVCLAGLFSILFALMGYLRREGAAIQFVRATYNTGLSFEKLEWSPTSLKITGLQFDPRRDDPDPQARCAPGKLFEAVDRAQVDSLTVQWGWRFLPEPTQVEFAGVRGVFQVQRLGDTWDWFQSLPPAPPRTFAFVLRDCRPELADFHDINGQPLRLPPFDLTIGPEVNGEATVNLIVDDRRPVDPISFRLNYDGSGLTTIHARNWKITRERWQWVRAVLHENAAAKAWWLLNADGQASPALVAWAEHNDLAGAFNCSLTAGLSPDRRRLDSLAVQAEITDPWLRRRQAPDGEPQTIRIQGALTLQAHLDHRRGGFQLDLGAGNSLLCNFDCADVPTDQQVRLPWEDWMERNLELTQFRLAGSYRYRAEYERGPAATPLLLQPLPAELRLQLTNLFACTQLEGAELRLQLQNSGELQAQIGQPNMHTYDAHITVRGPRTGPAAGSSAQLNLQLAEPPRPAGAQTPHPPAPVTFDLTIDADHFPVPGRNDMVYTGRFRLEQGSFTRRWLNDLLLHRDLDVHPLAVLPWLDPEQPRETLRVDRMIIEDGRLLAFGDMPFFVRNVNARTSLRLDTINPFVGSVNVLEVTGVQTGFGDHVVEFGPERLQGLLEFNLGSLAEGVSIDPWSDRNNDQEPANLFAAYLHSTVDPDHRWEFSYVLPWYMTRQRPGRMQAVNFPARLYPPGLNVAAGVLLDVHDPIHWEMSCWLEPSAIGEAAAAQAPLAVLPTNDPVAAARLTQALVHTGLPGKRLLIVHRSLSAKGIQIQTAGQFEAQGLALPTVGDTKSYPYPRE